VLFELDQDVVGLVGGEMEVRLGIFAGQGDVGAVAAIDHRQDAAGIAGVADVTDGGGRSLHRGRFGLFLFCTRPGGASAS
jgi:hypothetical protein